jgi:hypothetical protein
MEYFYFFGTRSPIYPPTQTFAKSANVDRYFSSIIANVSNPIVNKIVKIVEDSIFERASGLSIFMSSGDIKLMLLL